MKAGSHSMPEAGPEASASGQLVQSEVSPTHPLLLLKRALPWDAITETMTRHWRQHGKNVEGGRGLPWDVSLYAPLVVLMLIKVFDSRQMEAYLAENAVARVFIGRQHDAKAQIHDHSNIARAYAALGKAGIDAVNHLVVKEAQRFGFVDDGSLSADTTAQELPMGYPNEPGILRGLAQRCGRVLTQLKKRGVQGLSGALEQVQTILCSVKEHHLFTSGQAAKRQVLTRILTEVGALMVQTRPLIERLGTRLERVIQSARSRLMAMHEVIKPLMRQIVHWLSTGKVAPEQNCACGHPASPRHRAEQVGQENGIWLGLSDWSSGRRLSVWKADRGQCGRKADAAPGVGGVPGDLWPDGNAGVGGLRPRGRFDPNPPTARLGRGSGGGDSAQREAAVVGCRGSPGSDSQRA